MSNLRYSTVKLCCFTMSNPRYCAVKLCRFTMSNPWYCTVKLCRFTMSNPRYCAVKLCRFTISNPRYSTVKLCHFSVSAPRCCTVKLCRFTVSNPRYCTAKLSFHCGIPQLHYCVLTGGMHGDLTACGSVLTGRMHIHHSNDCNLPDLMADICRHQRTCVIVTAKVTVAALRPVALWPARTVLGIV